MRRRLGNELNRKTAEEAMSSGRAPFLLVMDNVRSLGNVGSIFRTADAFLTEAVYLCGITGKPPSREIQKTALGATESVKWKYYSKVTDAIFELKNDGYVIVAVEQAEGAEELQSFTINPDERYALIFGNEVHGVSQEALDLCDRCIEIPQFGMKHSFNISISVGIVLWELSRNHMNSPPYPLSTP